MNMQSCLDDAERKPLGRSNIATAKFAAAQACLTDSALVIPTMTSAGASKKLFQK